MSGFDFDAGALALDFVNTLEWRETDRVVDVLPDYEALVNWGEAAGLLETEPADVLRRLAERDPAAAAAMLDTAVALREALFRIFDGVAEENGGAAAADLALLNQQLETALPRLALVPESGGFDWTWRLEPPALDAVLWPVARSAADLLTSDRLDRVGQCADETGCGYLFLDTSRNRSRRWCSMESCGNRAKARRHYRKTAGNM